jgi:hypothetical protein
MVKCLSGKWVSKQGFELEPSEHEQGAWFERILTRFSMVFLSPSREVPGQYLKLGHNHVLTSLAVNTCVLVMNPL